MGVFFEKSKKKKPNRKTDALSCFSLGFKELAKAGMYLISFNNSYKPDMVVTFIVICNYRTFVRCNDYISSF